MFAETYPPALPSSATHIQGLVLFQLHSAKRRRGRRQRLLADLDDDLVSEILLRLPAKSVGRFRSVSRRWLSISSDPKFLQSHRSLHRSISGFFLSTCVRKSTYFPIESGSSPPPPAFFHPAISLPGIAPGPDSAIIDGLCDGFILYRSKAQAMAMHAVYPCPIKCRPLIYVCNLKTLEHTTLLAPERLVGWKHHIVSDPSRSPNHYKVISSGNRMHVYSSETGSWKVLFDPSPMPNMRSVYWDGSLFWLDKNLIRLDLEGECLSTMPWPGTRISCHYLGESRGRLHFIPSTSREGFLVSTRFDVLEMVSVDSGWAVLHHVDIGAIQNVYPEAIPLIEEEGKSTIRHLKLAISVVYFHRGAGGEGRGDQLLLSIPGKIVSYHLQNKTFMTIADHVVPQNEKWESFWSETEYAWWDFYPYVSPLSLLFDWPWLSGN